LRSGKLSGIVDAFTVQVSNELIRISR